VGAGVSVASVCGADKQYALNISLLMAIPVTIGLIAMDILAILGVGVSLSLGGIFSGLLCAVAAFAGAFVGIRVLRVAINNISMSVFGLYCWSVALFTFILYLTAA
jgi:undecaprenyl pyrophosphate phosphatase UppP